MKKHLFCLALCAFFVCVISVCGFIDKPHCFALANCAKIENSTNYQQNQTNNEQIELEYNHKFFIYNLKPNIKHSDIFCLNQKLNKYDRFKDKQSRIELLQNMLNVGFDTEIALNYIFPNLNSIIDSAEKNIFTKPQNASLKVNTNSEKVFYISKEKFGLRLNKANLYSQIAKAYLNNQKLSFHIPTTVLKPEIYAENFQKSCFLRGDFSTNISHSTLDRKHNIKNALNRLNLCEILPGQVFSFNKTIGKRTEENGYRTAKIIVNNEFVDGLGGGVCQVSSTLYNTALLAGLKIEEANKHSKQVGYVKYGFDAMVNFGSSDLKFKNTTGQKLTIVTNFNTNNIRIRIFGENLNGVEYKLVNEIVSTTPAGEDIKQDTAGEYSNKVQFEDESFVAKKGCPGMEVKSFRQKYENGILVDTELLRFDKFKAQNSVVVFGTKKRPTVFDLNMLPFAVGLN